MKTYIRFFYLTLALLLLQAAHTLAATASYTLELTDDSKLWIEGDSSLHAFDSTATVIQLASDVTPNSETAQNSEVEWFKHQKLSSLTLTVPIKDMTSHTKGLASPLRKALKQKVQPNIIFTMQCYDLLPNSEDQTNLTVQISGNLSIGGETNPIKLNMTGLPKGDEFEISGETELQMTDYGITPPSLMFGRIKVADQVVIKWELKLKLVATEGRA